MLKILGLVLLGFAMFICFIPVYSMAVFFVTTFLLGIDNPTFRVIETWSIYGLSALTAVAISRSVWFANQPTAKPTAPQATSLPTPADDASKQPAG